MKNPPTPAGIERATFRFVAQHLTVGRNVRIILVPRFLRTGRDMVRKLTYLFGTSGTRGILWYQWHTRYTLVLVAHALYFGTSGTRGIFCTGGTRGILWCQWHTRYTLVPVAHAVYFKLN